MASLTLTVRKHLDAALEEAGKIGYRPDETGRAVFAEVLRIWAETRNRKDIAAELVSAVENLDPDKDYTFMRP